MDLGPKLGHKLPTEWLAPLEPLVRWTMWKTLLVALSTFFLNI